MRTGKDFAARATLLSILMIAITNKVKPGTPVEVLGKLSLPYEQRQKRWLHAHLVSGEQVALRLRRGETLRGGDLLAAPRLTMSATATPRCSWARGFCALSKIPYWPRCCLAWARK